MLVFLENQQPSSICCHPFALCWEDRLQTKLIKRCLLLIMINSFNFFNFSLEVLSGTLTHIVLHFSELTENFVKRYPTSSTDDRET